jgi:hypothetical protein
MATLTIEQILDNTKATMKNQGKLSVAQIAQSLTDYPMASHFLRRNKMKITGGTSIDHDLLVRTLGSAQMKGLYSQDNYNVGDILEKINVPWRHLNTYWAFEEREVAMNSSKEKIVDLIGARRTAAQLDQVELLETQLWSKPTDSNDKLDMFGIPYWLVKNATTGFNGGNPSGFSSGAGGVDSSTETTWANYTAQYSNVSKSDAIAKMKTARRKTRFKSPVGKQAFRAGAGDRYRIHTSDPVVDDMENLGEAQNENIGKDLHEFDGMMTFGRNPVVYTPQLDSDSTNPIYMINYDTFVPFYLKGFFMKEASPRISPESHNTIVVDVDTSLNLLCTNRRLNTVLYV